MKVICPMLAEEAALGQIAYPKLASRKLNGVRGTNLMGMLLARSLKKIPNAHCQSLFSKRAFTNYDGELVVGPHSADDVFTRSTSGVMTRTGEPDVRWYPFDYYHQTQGLRSRLDILREQYAKNKDERIIVVEHSMIYSDEELVAFDDLALLDGYEGTVLREPDATYKCGRSTKEGFMRYVQWLRSEAMILGVNEKMHNANAAKKNELGRTARSSHKANQIPTGLAGALRVKDLLSGVEFDITVADTDQQKEFWAKRKTLPKKIIRYRYRKSVKIAPRFAQIDGLRDKRDM